MKLFRENSKASCQEITITMFIFFQSDKNGQILWRIDKD